MVYPLPASSSPPALRGAFRKAWRPGNCALCGRHTEHLEAHHITYSPERTLDICHACHFQAHFFPNRLPEQALIKLLVRIHTHAHALSLVKQHRHNPVALAKLIAPSRRAAIHEAQLAERVRVRVSRASERASEGQEGRKQGKGRKEGRREGGERERVRERE
jgi:hypothetical protein